MADRHMPDNGRWSDHGFRLDKDRHPRAVRNFGAVRHAQKAAAAGDYGPGIRLGLFPPDANKRKSARR